jgi:hypothetical protein
MAAWTSSVNPSLTEQEIRTVPSRTRGMIRIPSAADSDTEAAARATMAQAGTARVRWTNLLTFAAGHFTTEQVKVPAPNPGWAEPARADPEATLTTVSEENVRFYRRAMGAPHGGPVPSSAGVII